MVNLVTSLMSISDKLLKRKIIEYHNVTVVSNNIPMKLWRPFHRRHV